MSSRPAIVACLIVKNEEKVLERCLRSIRPYVDGYIIVDTGSTDSTIEIASREEFAGNNGIVSKVISRPWVNFGANRTEALALSAELTPKTTWSFMIDADDSVSLFPPPPPSAVSSSSGPDVKREVKLLHAAVTKASQTGVDGLTVKVSHLEIVHYRTQLFRNAARWTYVGAVHEYPQCVGGNGGKIGSSSEALCVIARTEGARSEDPEKYLKDAKMLRSEFAGTNPEGDETLCTNTRTCFYLAQSFQNGGKNEAAIRFYQQRIGPLEKVGFTDEVYISLVRLILLSKQDPEYQWECVWRAIAHSPKRLEAPHMLLSTRRLAKRASDSRTLAMIQMVVSLTDNFSNTLPPLPPGLFINQQVYEWQFADEVAVAAWQIKCAPLALRSATTAQSRYAHSPREKCQVTIERLESNVKFAKEITL